MRTRGRETYSGILALRRHGREHIGDSLLSAAVQARLYTAGEAIGPVIMAAVPDIELETRRGERPLQAGEFCDSEEILAAAERAGATIEPLRFERMSADELKAARAALHRGTLSVYRLVDQTMMRSGIPSGIRPEDCIPNTGALYIVPEHGGIPQATGELMAELGLTHQAAAVPQP